MKSRKSWREGKTLPRVETETETWLDEGSGSQGAELRNLGRPFAPRFAKTPYTSSRKGAVQMRLRLWNVCFPDSTAAAIFDPAMLQGTGKKGRQVLEYLRVVGYSVPPCHKAFIK